MNELMIKEDVSSKIIEVRGMNVILDRDIAKILGMETRVLNQSVKRNITMFNKNNYFQLDEDEFMDLKSQNDVLKSQFVTSKGGVRKLPYVFTKEEILILTSILKLKNDVVMELINAFDRQKLIVQNDDNISQMIYEIRGKQVMLDFDLAYLYECKNGTKEINQAVNRNKNKFPNDFCFQLTEKEFYNLRSQFVTSSLENDYGGRRYLPYAFTEQGVLMIATILKTEIAINTSIKIVNTFVAMKKYISYVSLPSSNLTNLVLEDHSRINNLEKAFDEFKEKEVLTEVYFEGQIYDAYSKILSIFKNVKKRLIVIDSYADNELLDIIKEISIEVIVITTNEYMKQNIVNRYNEQYHNLKVIYDNSFHDRYFIVDNNIYHSGSSINRIGHKTFSITKISDDITKDAIINKIEQIIR